MKLEANDLAAIKDAKEILENPGFGIKVVNYIGRPIEFALEKIDSKIVNNATKKALEKSLDLAIGTMDLHKMDKSSTIKHKLAVAASGGAGGFFGLPALPVELPISTTIMLRSIAQIAHCEGEDLTYLESRLQCLHVFALGSGKSRSDDEADSAYYAARMGLAYEMRAALDAVKGMSQKQIQDLLAREQVSVLVKLINSIASRFGITVSEKVIAQSVPLIGAAGGSAINTLFIDHYQDMAKAHFIIRRLEKKYGEGPVEEWYRKL